jgi:hypothetical protein
MCHPMMNSHSRRLSASECVCVNTVVVLRIQVRVCGGGALGLDLVWHWWGGQQCLTRLSIDGFEDVPPYDELALKKAVSK